MNDSQKRKIVWILLGIIVLIMFFSLRSQFHKERYTKGTRFSPPAAGFFDCTSDVSGGDCTSPKHALSSCTQSNGNSGICRILLGTGGQCKCGPTILPKPNTPSQN